MPDAAPSEVAWPSRMRSVSSQPSMAVPVAMVVVMNVAPAMPLEPTAEPALKPYQPNHSRPAPSITNGRLCGRIGLARPAEALAEDDGQHQARGTGVDVHRGTTREVDCLEFVGNPAAVLTGDAVEREHPVRDREVHDRRPTGATNSSQPPNFSRSATAPEIRATVMMANISWKATNTVCGMVPASGI